MGLGGAWLLPDTCLVKLTTISRGLFDGPPSKSNKAGLVPQAVVRLDWRLYQEAATAPRFCATFAETKVARRV